MKPEQAKRKPPPDEAFTNTQLSLFQDFLCNNASGRDKLSNTIELWDGVPKYYVSRQQMNKERSKDGHLPTVEREFDYRGKTFTVEIQPARLKIGHGRYKEFYPSAREELVEDALRKIATEQRYGFLEARESGAVFTLHMLRKELRQRGHALSYQEVVEALEVMASCQVKINAADGSGGYQSSILVGLLRVSRDRYREDPKARWVAYFSPLVTQSIRELTYRQYDYHTMMSHRTQLARWLHKRLSHNYIYASLLHPYTALFSSVRRDSGLLEYTQQRDAIRTLDEALAELKSHQVLLDYKKDVRVGQRNKILDVLYTLMPAPQFVDHVKTANRRLQDAQDKVVGLGRGSPTPQHRVQTK